MASEAAEELSRRESQMEATLNANQSALMEALTDKEAKMLAEFKEKERALLENLSQKESNNVVDIKAREAAVAVKEVEVETAAQEAFTRHRDLDLLLGQLEDSKAQVAAAAVENEKKEEEIRQAALQLQDVEKVGQHLCS